MDQVEIREVIVLKTDNPQASQFYRKLGFTEVHGDPHVTHVLEFHD